MCEMKVLTYAEFTTCHFGPDFAKYAQFDRHMLYKLYIASHLTYPDFVQLVSPKPIQFLGDYLYTLISNYNQIVLREAKPLEYWVMFCNGCIQWEYPRGAYRQIATYLFFVKGFYPQNFRPEFIALYNELDKR